MGSEVSGSVAFRVFTVTRAVMSVGKVHRHDSEKAFGFRV